MRFALYSPYLDSFGGGERYLATIAEYLARKGKAVIFWNDKKILPELESRFNLDLDNVEIEKNIFDKNFWKRRQVLKNFDLVFVLSDGSIPTPFADRNILHFQQPVTAESKNFKNWLKLKRYIVVCNSNFTKKYIDESFGVNSQVIYPPIDIDFFTPPAGRKQKIILSVGRFLSGAEGKKQDVLIEAFSSALSSHNSVLKDWQLYLAGSVVDKNYFDKLKKSSRNLPVKFFPDNNSIELKKLYSAASIYWHAKGFGEDIAKNPKFAEHFGISIVEAQSAGCVPVVFEKGGVVEVINASKNGLFWKTFDELIENTKKIIADNDLFDFLQQNAIQDAKKFSKNIFLSKMRNLLKGGND